MKPAKEVIGVQKDKMKSKIKLSDQRVLSLTKEVKSTKCIKELAQLLSTGKWIAICASEDGEFILSRIS